MNRDSLKLGNYFSKIRRGIIGNGVSIKTPYGMKTLVYMDWTASGRLYRWVEKLITEKFGPMMANTHSGSTTTGQFMTNAYHHAQSVIKRQVGAGPDDVIITDGSGMTGVVVKLQRMLGLKVPAWAMARLGLTKNERPVVFVTSMEHHSNHTSWLETIADVVVIPLTKDGRVNLRALRTLLKKYKRRSLKIGSFSACSNVTGIMNPVHEMAKIMHQHGGLCFIDYAASAPYVEINMHPRKDPLHALDAVFISPHKFLGGPGTPGVMVVSKFLLASDVPDVPGGGTVNWTNPWNGRSYVGNIEAREDGGTPPILQVIRAGLVFELKQRMGVKRIAARKKKLLARLFRELDAVPGLKIMAGNIRDRQAIVSFVMTGVHYGLVVRLLNDRFGIQTRGGCSCAGTYGHILFGISKSTSKHICSLIDQGDSSEKPGWARISLHPTTTFREVSLAGKALREIAANAGEWMKDYRYNPKTNEYEFVGKAVS